MIVGADRFHHGLTEHRLAHLSADAALWSSDVHMLRAVQGDDRRSWGILDGRVRRRPRVVAPLCGTGGILR